MSNKDFEEKIGGALEKARKYLLSRYQFTYSNSDIDDILQEASLKAMKKLNSFQEKCSFDTWFISICKTEATAIFRKNKKHETYFSKDATETDKEFFCEESPVKRKSELDECLYLVNNALSKLNEKNRKIIEFAMENSNSSKEIAELLHIPINSARTRLFYAKKRLKKILLQNNQLPCNKYCSFDF